MIKKARNLAWKGVGSRLHATAFGIEFFYLVNGKPGDWTLTSPGAHSYVSTPGYETQRAAQAAAQTDFERRVSAEIETD